jgi:hypothetical protein
VKGLQNWQDLMAPDRQEVRAALNSQGVEGDPESPTVREDMVERLLATVRVTDAIVRNRKRTVGGFTRRVAKTYPVQLTTEEMALYGRLTDYLRRGFAAARSKGDRLLGFEMVTFHRLLSSSSAALTAALANRRWSCLASRTSSTLWTH